MDYKQIKELSIQQFYDGKPDTITDEYRSVSKQIDNFCAHLQKEDSPLNWLPLDAMTEKEVSQIICRYLRRPAKSRLLLQNLGYQGLKYDYYSSLIADDPEGEREKEQVLETLPVLGTLGTFDKVDIAALIDAVKWETRFCGGGYYALRDRLAQVNTDILLCIMDEKNLIKRLGVGFTNPLYVEAYLSIVETMVIETLMSFIIRNDFVKDKLSALRIIEEKIDGSLAPMIDERVAKSKEEWKKRREFFREVSHLDENYAFLISIYYTQYLTRQAFYDELDSIQATLIKETERHPNLFSKPLSPGNAEVSACDSKALISLLTEGESVPQALKKADETRELLKTAYANGNLYAGSDFVSEMRPVFREAFISKSSHRKKQAMSIARDILARKSETFVSPAWLLFRDEETDANAYRDTAHLMFLDEKIARGCFRERGLMAEYRAFVGVCSKFRRILLKTYSALRDEGMYRIIETIGWFALYEFYEEPKLE